jgi:hypothetical protein
MLIYNVTSQISWEIQEAWLQWMKTTHIPEVIGSGCFTHHRLVRVLEIDETEGPTYAVQYFTDTTEQYQRYMKEYAAKLRAEAIKAWGKAFISYRSLMEVVH